MPLPTLATRAPGAAVGRATAPPRAGPHSVRGRPLAPSRRAGAPIPATPAAAEPSSPALSPAITVTPAARARLAAMLAEKQAAGSPASILRVGVKSGGCNGMSYTMDWVPEPSLTPDDAVFDLGEGVRAACDPKSLLFLFGLELGFSDELIGGGFSFQNPNAEGACGCGKSFNV